ncbi:collagen-binding domain-containing protein [Sandaracinobacteroides hominis]|uniref:collagen-binding domain-containing protein n=1 Tax=Sandaracinobacteroides hominis TaxID=2780086 RepID=UPI0018F4A0F9|nr:collagen-binding domain-containing protein [Sandaracinobacteroides hominis]
MNSRLLAGVFASALVSTVSMPAMAAAPVGDPLAGLQAMREVNLIVLGDMKGGSNVEGKTFVGGNLSNGSTFGTGRGSQGATDSSRATLTVVGNVTGNGINLNNGTNAASKPGLIVGGSLNSGVNLNAQGATVKIGGVAKNINGSNGSTIQAGGKKEGNFNSNGASSQFNLGDSFTQPLVAGLTAEQSQLSADLKALSVELAGLEATAGNSTSVFGSRLTFNAVDNGKGYSVFNMSDSLFNFGEFDMKVSDPAMTILINITGDGKYDWNANSIGGLNAALNDNIIWNFSDATGLNVNRMTHGSILAPYAALANRADLEGSIVAGSFNQGGQVHLGTYQGNLDPAMFSEAVPEPATWAMLIAGFGLVGVAARRRRANAGLRISIA